MDRSQLFTRLRVHVVLREGRTGAQGENERNGKQLVHDASKYLRRLATFSQGRVIRKIETDGEKTTCGVRRPV